MKKKFKLFKFVSLMFLVVFCVVLFNFKKVSAKEIPDTTWKQFDIGGGEYAGIYSYGYLDLTDFNTNQDYNLLFRINEDLAYFYNDNYIFLFIEYKGSVSSDFSSNRCYVNNEGVITSQTNYSNIDAAYDYTDGYTWNNGGFVAEEGRGFEKRFFEKPFDEEPGTSGNYVRFVSAEARTITPKYTNSGVTLQYSVDSGATWTTIASGSETTSATEHWFRGQATGTKSLFSSYSYNNAWAFSGNSDLEVYGNLNFLLCDALGDEEAPTSLGDYAYAYMFYGCTSLTTAPELPATTLGSYCYYCMFQSCTSLTTAPELPATTIASSCYEEMFRGCTSFKVSETNTGSYTYAWRIPTSGTGTTASGWNSYMLYGTGGSFTSNPTINKTYWVENKPVSSEDEEAPIINGEYDPNYSLFDFGNGDTLIIHFDPQEINMNQDFGYEEIGVYVVICNDDSLNWTDFQVVCNDYIIGQQALAYDSGYQAGIVAGESIGYNQGYNEGYNNGILEGQNDPNNQRYWLGYRNAIFNIWELGFDRTKNITLDQIIEYANGYEPLSPSHDIEGKDINFYTSNDYFTYNDWVLTQVYEHGISTVSKSDNTYYDNTESFDYRSGYGQAWGLGYDLGYSEGSGRDLTPEEESIVYNWGYNDGYKAGQEDHSVGGLLKQAFGGVGQLLDYELLPNLTIGGIVIVPLLLGIIFFILKRG